MKRVVFDYKKQNPKDCSYRYFNIIPATISSGFQSSIINWVSDFETQKFPSEYETLGGCRTTTQKNGYRASRRASRKGKPRYNIEEMARVILGENRRNKIHKALG